MIGGHQGIEGLADLTTDRAHLCLNVDIGQRQRFPRNVHSPSALTADFDRNIEADDLMRDVTGHLRAHVRIRNLTRDVDRGFPDLALSPGGRQVEVP